MKKYYDGLKMGQFERIEKISHYNFNYYVGFDKDLLFGQSDDDNTTEWWIVTNSCFIYLGESYCGEGDILHLFERPRT